jgi:hypothetical protein
MACALFDRVLQPGRVDRHTALPERHVVDADAETASAAA